MVVNAVVMPGGKQELGESRVERYEVARAPRLLNT